MLEVVVLDIWNFKRHHVLAWSTYAPNGACYSVMSVLLRGSLRLPTGLDCLARKTASLWAALFAEAGLKGTVATSVLL